jgi:hypothetical protein
VVPTYANSFAYDLLAWTSIAFRYEEVRFIDNRYIRRNETVQSQVLQLAQNSSCYRL